MPTQHRHHSRRERRRLVDLLWANATRNEKSSSSAADRHSSTIRRFVAAFAPATYPNNEDQDDTAAAAATSSSRKLRGVPWLMREFDAFDPLNDSCCSGHEPLAEHHLRAASERDFYHLDRYLLADQFSADRLLRDRSLDRMALAVYSFALSWSADSLERYASRSCTSLVAQSSALPADSAAAADLRRAFVDALLADRATGQTCFSHPHGFVYSRSTFRTLSRALRGDVVGADELRLPRRPFRLSDLLPLSFRDELDRLHRALLHDEPSLATWTPARCEPIPYRLEHRLGPYSELKRAARVKFVTGQACCGKTSVLNRLRSRGWLVFSRGALGSFAGKASDPLAVFGLHAAIDWTLRRDNALGDRCSIDNPLWRFIMPLCDPSLSSVFVDRLLEFIDAAFNEPVIGYLIEQHGAVFVDARVTHCANRMLRRGTGGDAQRGRLVRYASAQCVAYYAMARLFGWRVYTVPYAHRSAERSELDGHRFEQLADEIGDWFGELRDQRYTGNSLTAECGDGFARPAGVWDPDTSYPRSVSIYK